LVTEDINDARVIWIDLINTAFPFSSFVSVRTVFRNWETKKKADEKTLEVNPVVIWEFILLIKPLIVFL